MDKIINLLQKYKQNEISEHEILSILKKLPFEDLGFSKVDHHRSLRTGYPEVIFCEGKENDQITQIAQRILDYSKMGLLATRANSSAYDAILQIAPDAVYHKSARVVTVTRGSIINPSGLVCVVSAGTADIPVAEEAAIVCEALGHQVDRIYDVGVAGIHRLLSQVDRINNANVVIAVAGMEGALASVIGGLTDSPVIAVPTSIGYGASFGGLSALLTMLNSCAAGVGVVNIDNGFGAAWLANNIIRSISKNNNFTNIL